MAQYELLLPKMGESVAEATIIKWVKQPGDKIEMDDTILEIATDKVDSEVPSPVVGRLVKQLFKEDDIVQVGAVIAIIETDMDASVSTEAVAAPVAAPEKVSEPVIENIPGLDQLSAESSSDRFYSPLVKNIAAQEGIHLTELDGIAGTGSDGRLTKDDLLNYIQNKGGKAPAVAASTAAATAPISAPVVQSSAAAQPVKAAAPQAATSVSGGDEIIEMDRMRKLIADHMTMSKQTSPHVTSFVEADVTNMVMWREKVKKNFEKGKMRKLLLHQSL